MNLLIGDLIKTTEQIVYLAVTSGWEERVREFAPLLKESGGTALFLSALLEHIGLPLPAIPRMLAAGAMAKVGKISASLAFGLPAIGTLLANVVWYALGRFRGRQMLALFCGVSDDPSACIVKTESMFTRHPVSTLIVSKFLPGFGAIAEPLAAMAGMRTLPFLIIDAIGAALYAAIYVGMGYAFSGHLVRLAQSFVKLGNFALVLGIAAALSAPLLLHMHRGEKKEKSHA